MFTIPDRANGVYFKVKRLIGLFINKSFRCPTYKSPPDQRNGIRKLAGPTFFRPRIP